MFIIKLRINWNSILYKLMQQVLRGAKAMPLTVVGKSAELGSI